MSMPPMIFTKACMTLPKGDSMLEVCWDYAAENGFDWLNLELKRKVYIGNQGVGFDDFDDTTEMQVVIDEETSYSDEFPTAPTPASSGCRRVRWLI